jgi:hypothetical protein
MKNLFTLYMLVSLPLYSFLLLGCEDDSYTPQETETNQTQEETQQEESSQTEEVEMGKDITFHEIIEIDSDTLITDSEKKEIMEKIRFSEEAKWADMEYLYEWHEVGTINVDPYKGWKLLVLDLQCDGMCMSTFVHRFAYNKETEELVLLNKYGPEYEVSDYINAFLSDTDDATTLPSLELPETIIMPDIGQEFELQGKDQLYLPEEIGPVAFTDSKWGPLHFAQEESNIGCVYLYRPDGSYSAYAYGADLFEKEDENIEFNDGSEDLSVQDYALSHSGCGIMGSCYYIDEVDENNLELVGSTTHGIDLYEVKNPEENVEWDSDKSGELKKLASLYQSYSRTASYEGSDKPELTFEEFNNTKPLLFWQDPFGRWTSITHNDAKIPAECGKPVIYLYPEEETDVHVEVDIDEFTVTIPDYGNNGWDVRANPDGTLYNYADGQTYPYLFWEGIKKDGIEADAGFSVKRDELYTFLTESLGKMGLNEQEKTDFIEFWYPRMMKNNEPYFFISFVGTAEFNKVAPLSIEPKPDTLIRVFMYYDPTFTPYKVRSQELKSIPREGFTVLEWGGTSSRTWQY